MDEALTPDLCVIGAGAGGLSVATASAAMGAPTVLIEKAATGGAFPDSGRIGFMALAAAARARRAATGLRRFGLAASPVQVDFPAVMAHVRETVRACDPDRSEARFRAMGVHVIRASARFIARDRVEADGRVIRARRFVIATGSRRVMPNIPGLEQIRVHTDESILSLKEAPGHLVVIGADPVGAELAQAFARLDVPVTLIDAGRALAREEDEFADLVRTAIIADGVALRENMRVSRVEAHGEGFRLYLENGEAIGGAHLFVAAGRRPDIEGLGLEAAGVRHAPGGVLVGDDLRTSNRRIYCIGEAACLAQPAHAAAYHAGLVLRSTLFRLRARLVPGLVPRVVFTDPEIATAGLSEAEARKTFGKIRVLRWPLADNDRARAEGVLHGHVKIVLSRNGAVLGAAIAGPGAADMIALWQLAVAQRMKIQAVATLVLPYSTLSEVSKKAALQARAPGLASPRLRSLLGILRKFG